MKFREWFRKIEEAQQRSRAYDANVITTTAAGPFARHGSPDTMLPISRGLDNRAVASVIDAIGTSRADNRREMGFDVRATSRIEPFPSERQPYMETRYMALQYPQGWMGHRNYGTGLVNTIRSMVPEPGTDPKVWKIDERMQLIKEPKIDNRFQLYLFKKGQQEREILISAINFTKALMHVDLANSLDDYKTVLNLDKLDFVDEKTMEYQVPGHEDLFYKVLFCAFIINKRHKDDPLDRHDIDDEEFATAARQRRPEDAPRPTPTPPSPATTEPVPHK